MGLTAEQESQLLDLKNRLDAWYRKVIGQPPDGNGDYTRSLKIAAVDSCFDANDHRAVTFTVTEKHTEVAL